MLREPSHRWRDAIFLLSRRDPLEPASTRCISGPGEVDERPFMGIPKFSTLTELVDAARDVPPSHGVRFVSPQFRETYASYSELHRRVLFHADNLLRQDVEPGDTVVVPLTTDPDVLCSFLALIWIGAIPVSVSGQ